MATDGVVCEEMALMARQYVATAEPGWEAEALPAEEIPRQQVIGDGVLALFGDGAKW